MQLIRLSLAILLITSTPAVAQNTKDMFKDLQRDIAQLQQDLKLLNSKFDEKISAMSAVLSQALTESGQANKGVAVLDRLIKDSLKETQTAVTVPIATLNERIGTLSGEYSKAGENIDELGKRITKIDSKLNELKTLIQTMNTPPVPPPGTSPTTPGQVSACPAGTATPEQVFTQALRDKEGGQFTLSLQEFKDFMTCWPKEERAGVAQYYIGEIHFNNRSFDDALQALDVAIDTYPENAKTADAMYLKGRIYLQTDQKNKARTILAECAKKYPNTDAGRRAANLLKTVASSSPTPVQRKRK